MTLTRGEITVNDFERKIAAQYGHEGLFSDTIETLQVNLGLKCNQQCLHCHMESSPERKEMMEWPVMELILRAVESSCCRRADLTGGAPELNPYFQRFVTALREKGCLVQTRTNLTVLLDPGMEDLPGFFKDHGGSSRCFPPVLYKGKCVCSTGPGSLRIKHRSDQAAKCSRLRPRTFVILEPRV